MYYIGIDVSKKALSVFDGKSDLEFENTEGLKAFKRYLKKQYQNFENLGIIFEATGIYSESLKVPVINLGSQEALRLSDQLSVYPETAYFSFKSPGECPGQNPVEIIKTGIKKDTRLRRESLCRDQILYRGAPEFEG